MPDVAAALAFARAQIGETYVYGATGPDHWDCSGLTQAAWRAGGVSISRTSSSQLLDGVPITKRADLQPGDLVFPQYGHVQLYSGGGNIIEAPRTGERVKERPMWGFWTARRVTGAGTIPGAQMPTTGGTTADKLRAAAGAAGATALALTPGGSSVLGAVEGTNGAVNAVKDWHGLVAAVQDPTLWLRVGKFAAGYALVILGIVVAVGPARIASGAATVVAPGASTAGRLLTKGGVPT